jgi:hypothetical protein
MTIRTIFVMAQECARGERAGWHDFARDYGPLARQLLQRYFPLLVPELDGHVLGVFQRARSQENQWFRGLAFRNEREFMMDFRELLFGYAREQARIPVPQLTLEQVRAIMNDLTVIEREMLWLFIKGYDAENVAGIIMDAETTSGAVKKVADERLAQVLPGTSPDSFNISARVLIEAAEKAGTPECLPWKTFNNMVNGQISWRERELAEQHIKDCFHCLDRFTSFLEMIRIRKAGEALPEPQVESILRGLNLPASKAKGVLARLFSKS